MKKVLSIAILSIMLMASPVRAQVAVVPVECVGCYTGGPAFWPFFGAVAFSAFVVYANATGIDFPLCGPFKCEYTYPEPRG